MYNGQFIKGLVHVVIFAVLVSAAHVYGIFGLFIAAWIFYQSFEAYHTAKARRDGQPLPDPLGLNEVGRWFNPGGQPPPFTGQPGPYTPPPGQDQTGQAQAVPGQPGQGPAAGAYPPYGSPYQPPYQTPWQPGPYTPPAAGFVDPAVPPIPPVPPVPPVPPLGWRRKEPIGAVILIGLGLLFLLGQMDFFSGRLFEFTWPVLLIGLGIWLIVRRLGDSQGGSK
jgi:hypothetical protein